MIATDELPVELTCEPRDRATEDGDAVDELVSDARELLLAGRLGREPPRNLLLARGEHVDAKAARVANGLERVRGVIEGDEHEQRLQRERCQRIGRRAPGPAPSVLVTTATPVAQLAISRRSSRASRVALTSRMVAHADMSDSAVAERSFDVS